MLHVDSLQLSYIATLNFSTQNHNPFSKRVRLVCCASSLPKPSLRTASTYAPQQTLAPTTISAPRNTERLTTQTPVSASGPASIPTSSSATTPISPSASDSTSLSNSRTTPNTQSHERKDPKLYPWLIVGIGNPGNKFQKTRHNVGFEVIDAIAQAEGIKLNTIQQRALTGKGQIGSTQVLLAKPQTYVNLTGQSVGPLAAYYRIPVQHILVIYDDTGLEFGLMRLATKGGSTSNNGVKSVIEHLKGCRVFPRLRLGIGSVPGTMDPGAFVLQRFDESEREEMDALIAQAPILIREMITKGIEETASVWNEKRKSRMHLTPEEREFLKRF